MTGRPTPDVVGCGNSTVDPGEQCDKLNLDGKTCAALGYDGGTLACSASCTFNLGGCYKCGDGVKNGNEACDKTDIGKTCQDLGFGGGTLSCSTSCTLLTGSCSTQGWATIPGGLFSMGSPTTEPCRDATDETQHQVTLTHGFRDLAEGDEPGGVPVGDELQPGVVQPLRIELPGRVC